MKKYLVGFVLAPLQVMALSEPQYCLALRGNGELMPAHWGALARTIETFGLPHKAAGGSSASLSLFLLESLQRNPILDESDFVKRSQQVAFLLKSIEGYASHQFSQPEWQDFLKFLGKAQSVQRIQSVEDLESALRQLKPRELRRVMSALSKIKQGQVFYGPAVEKLHQHILVADQSSAEWSNRLSQLVAQVQAGLGVLGKFDAKNDSDLFLRDAVINFKALAQIFEKLTQFYSLTGASQNLQQRFSDFMKICSEQSQGKTWSEIVQTRPECQPQLSQLVRHYERYVRTPESLLDQSVGAFSPSIVATGIVAGVSADQIRSAKRAFDRDFQKTHGENLKIESADVFYGYTGTPQDLHTAARRLNDFTFPGAQLDKSQRFLELEQMSWREALSMSAAEPGLSSYVETRDSKGNSVLSTGGWSDLHPVTILKASGCENVIYVTRKGGDTIFGQGVAKRLFGFEKPWSELDPHEPSRSRNRILNNQGDPKDMTSQWSRMFNLANPNSNFDYALQTSDAVVCTNWNSFDVKKDFHQMIFEAYHAPIFNPSNMTLLAAEGVRSLAEVDNKITSEGFREFSGCISFSRKR